MFRHQHFTLNVRLLHFFTGLSNRSGLEPIWLKLLEEQNLEADEPTNFSLRAGIAETKASTRKRKMRKTAGLLRFYVSLLF